LDNFVRSYLVGGEVDPDELKARLKEENPGALIQTADAAAARNGYLLRLIAAQTLRAEASGRLLAKTPGMDFLLRLAGTTQISEAIRAAGTRRGADFLLVVAGREELPRLRGGKVLPSKRLSEEELQRVEKAALLGTARSR
jgi:tRNA threonylcarbamoyladenosine modification (KEOPS) complex Cgi121 subunit